MAKKTIEELLAVGRRKTSVASVRLRRGTGKCDLNGKALDEYFKVQEQRDAVIAPLLKFELKGEYDLIVRLKGGGAQSQAIAARLAVSRALVSADEEKRKPLKDLGFLTRDPRMKERKKYGRAKARKKFQFSKR